MLPELCIFRKGLTMGLLTDVVALGKKSRKRVLEKPYDSAPWFQAKGIGTIELARLSEFLGVGRSAQVSAEMKVLASKGEEGPWLQSLPQVLLDGIASLTDAEVTKVCKRWAKIEEFGGDRSTKQLVEYLRGLRTFLKNEKGPFALYIGL